MSIMMRLLKKLNTLFILLPMLAQAQYVPPEPAFEGQTGAPRLALSSNFTVETIATGLRGPWAINFLPDGNILVTEAIGNLRTVSPDGEVSDPIAGVPGVKSVAAQSFHDVLLDPDFDQNRIIYFTYFAPPKGEEPGSWPISHFYEDVWTLSLAERRVLDLGTARIGKARLSNDNRNLENVEILYEGGAERRIVLAPDGSLYVTGADSFRFYDSDLDGMEFDFTDEPDIARNFSGRVIRINRDGTVPSNNPWLDRATVPRELYAHGLRDPEGAAINPATGQLWIIDHGPQGGDEINVIKPRADYGWPNYTYGVQYDDRQPAGRTNIHVGTGLSSAPGIEEPIYYWTPSIAPSGMAFYTGELFPEWQGNLFVGAMAGRALIRLVLDGDRVIGEERMLRNLDERIREVRTGPDGAVYFLAGGSLMRLVPE
jgi:aldose sugar dehydrogenase